MTHGAARMGWAASAAIVLIAAAVLPANAQQKIYPSGTDCTKLVGNDKANCEMQSKNTASPDNANNPDNSEINTSNPPTWQQQPIGAPSAGAAGNGVNVQTSPASNTSN